MLEFNHNGHKMSSQQIGDGTARGVIVTAIDVIEARLKSLIDPETGQPVGYAIWRQDGATLWSIHGSPQAVAAAKKIMGCG